MYIDDPRKWRISKGGYEIKAGYSDMDARVVARYAGIVGDHATFNRWLEDAERICDLHNAALTQPNQRGGEG